MIPLMAEKTILFLKSSIFIFSSVGFKNAEGTARIIKSEFDIAFVRSLLTLTLSRFISTSLK